MHAGLLFIQLHRFTRARMACNIGHASKIPTQNTHTLDARLDVRLVPSHLVQKTDVLVLVHCR